MNESVLDAGSGRMSDLYGFQREGVQFLLDTKRALLADSMGLGKSVQALAACECLWIAGGKGSVLIVCPNSVVLNWTREIEKWFPEFTYQVLWGSQDERVELLRQPAHFYIINYEILRYRSNEGAVGIGNDLLRRRWLAVVLDEAHRIKNRDSQRTKVCKQLTQRAQNVYLLSGTPIMNYPTDIWSLLNILDRKAFSSYWRFVWRYCNVYHNGFGWMVGDLVDPDSLKETLVPYMLRREKSEVLVDFPSKVVQQFWVRLDPKHQVIYDQMEEEMIAKLEDTDDTVIAPVVIAQITRLKQIAVDPELMVDDLQDRPLEGAKADALIEIIQGTDEKVVVFSQFRRAVNRLAVRFDKEGITYAVIHGGVTGDDRQAAIDHFQSDPSCQVFLCTTQTGGQGINLTAASIGVFLDRCWAPGDNLQAQDRLHRIGQTKPVTIIELLAEHTIEVRIDKLLRKKTDWTNMVITSAELKGLFDDETT